MVGRTDLGRLVEGGEADVAVLGLERRRFDFIDVEGPFERIEARSGDRGEDCSTGPGRSGYDRVAARIARAEVRPDHFEFSDLARGSLRPCSEIHR